MRASTTNAFTFGPVLDAVFDGIKMILENQVTILANQARLESQMADDFTALNQADDDLKAAVADAVANMDKLFADLTAALGGGNQTAIDAATAAVQAQIDKLKAATAADQDPIAAPPAGP